MSIAVDALLTTAPGLQAPWVGSNVDLNAVQQRIDFEMKSDANKVRCPACGVDGPGVNDVTLVHDLEARRWLLMMAGRDHETVAAFKQELVAHGGDADHIKYVFMDMSAAYAKDMGTILPTAQISYDCFHVIALANAAIDEMRARKRALSPKPCTQRWAMMPAIQSTRWIDCSART